MSDVARAVGSYTADTSVRLALPRGSHYFRGVEGMEMTSPDDQLEIHFQEAHGARLFRKGTPRATLEVKSSYIPTEIYEARLRGYDEAKERSPVSKRRETGGIDWALS
jgi:hypothetical protein